MKITSLAFVLAAVLVPGTADAAPAHHTAVVPGTAAAASAHHAAARAHHFRNCTDMHHTYKGGVARKGAHDHRKGGGHARYAPHVSTRLYKANASMDRDHDGIACEQ